MTTIYDDPDEFAEDQLAGFLALYADRLRGVPGGVVTHRTEGAAPQVAVVIGGGSGHYPAFCGTVGPGLATGAVVGNIFTSPSAAQAYSVAKAADQGRGVVFSFGNYAGDIMNFGIAAERLRKEGVDTRIVVVTDDIASAEEIERRRGIAGDFSVFKAMGAAAAEGLTLDEVERVGNACNAATRTLGVAFSGCTMPGAAEPLFSVPEGHLGLGLGIHGEPGIRDVELLRAADLADLFVDRLLADRPEGGATRVAPILNGLGTTKYEELFLLWRHIARRLEEAGVQTVEPEVGELVTSLDMGGVSLTLQWLDDELERFWRADAYTPAYRRVAAPVAALLVPASGADAEAGAEESAPPATAAAVALAATVREALAAVHELLRREEETLGRIDAVAGDGDHGRGMLKGIGAATRRLDRIDGGAGGAWLLSRAGQAWAEQAGGTSGVLWGAALEALAASLTDSREEYPPAAVVDGVDAFAESIVDLGRASEGDKTMLDALLPFARTLRERVHSGSPLVEAWREAAGTAVARAAATADLRPKVGRARPLAEKSLGTPDAGATSMGMILTTVGDVLGARASASRGVPA
ncbi:MULTISPECIES: dihydroxyacetone kinase family protein [unclassified Rathayibacter]|uniref:dihydroxyacetone kinase family protein n=1 Tax=unclassified Rathayibacter TaxID=2609250 RepID=UPI000CE7679B|nr:MULTISPECIES: dihydroxyacetone kinase family protein [unclassified Rathayibacter]PPF39525.1 D-erythrulose kinase [Rathayibacter sp. AY1A3]PPG10163.1 D-erythrulose kinase [Rathayibacter sp. AY2B1]PPG62076.1 D-erythrulose kinase [Rathayibacter sp. AY2B7]PPG73795.1 D-erythrulose kinase [Rathayibacter sp. AY1F4]